MSLRRSWNAIVLALVALFGLLLIIPHQVLAQSELLYGVNAHDDGLSIINPSTGEVTFIGMLDPDPKKLVAPIAMAVRPSDGEIFVWNNSDEGTTPLEIIPTGVLLTVDKCTGLATKVNANAPNQGQMSALAFGPADTLFGFGLRSEGGYALYQIDTITGVKAELLDLLGLRIGGADFDDSGILHGVQLTSWDDIPKLVRIEYPKLCPVCGEPLELGETSCPACGSSITPQTSSIDLSESVGVIGSIVFEENGTLIGSAFVDPTEGNILFDINPVDGTVSNIQPVIDALAPQGMGFALPCKVEVLIPDQVNDSHVIYGLGCAEDHTLSQSFTPQASPLVAVDLRLMVGGNFPSVGSVVTHILIRPVLGDEGNRLEMDYPLQWLSAIASVTAPQASGNKPWVRYVFPEPLEVTPGNMYVIEWFSPGHDILSWICADADDSGASDPYGDGSAYGCADKDVNYFYTGFIAAGDDFLFITYTSSAANTPEGTDVVVQLTNPATAAAIDATLTFDEINEAGTSSLNISQDGESPPAGFMLGDPPVYYEINTTADYSGPIQVCIDYSEIDFANENALTLYHFEDADGDGVLEWEPLDSVTDQASDVICATVDSLSSFAILEPEVPIDIRPFSRYNIIIPWKKGLIPVAILSTDDFYAPDEVDRASLTFGRTGDEQSKVFCMRRARDVNRDGLKDIVCFFRTSLTDFEVGDTRGILKGLTLDGTEFQSYDAVLVKGKKKWHPWKKR